jgi:hypothetical protein
VVTRFDAHPNGWIRLIFPLFLVITRRAERNNGRFYKRALESKPVLTRFPDAADLSMAAMTW